MTFFDFSFYVFALVSVIGGLRMITVQNPVKAALYLVMTFISTAAIWVMLEAEFLGIVLILVYVGAVMVLFLFVVMMLDINLVPLQEGFTRYLPLGITVAIVVLVEMLMVVGPGYLGVEAWPAPAMASADYSNTKALGEVLYTVHVYAFELAAVLLLLAMIAAITLIFRRRPTEEALYQNIDEQVRVQASDRLTMVHIDSNQVANAKPAVTTAKESVPHD